MENQPLSNGADQPRGTLKLNHLYCKKDLLKMYGISYKTLEAWLEPKAALIGPPRGRFYTRRQLIMIFEIIGYPDEFFDF